MPIVNNFLLKTNNVLCVFKKKHISREQRINSQACPLLDISDVVGCFTRHRVRQEEESKLFGKEAKSW